MDSRKMISGAMSALLALAFAFPQQLPAEGSRPSGAEGGASSAQVGLEAVGDASLAESLAAALREETGQAAGDEAALAEEGRSDGGRDGRPAPDEPVRVAIAIDGKSTLEAVYANEGSEAGPGDVGAYSDQSDPRSRVARIYRGGLERRQASVAERIDSQIEGGIDVQWNLTLAANAVSAYARYDQIEAIEAVPGVAGVEVERQYEPMEPVSSADEAGDGAQPQMALSGGMVGVSGAWGAGYTGAGARIAVIDTGIDADHVSFAEGDWLYSLERNASGKGMGTEDYMESLGLLSADEVSDKLSQLNVRKKRRPTTADDLRVSGKVPFAFNYVDCDTDVTHDNDSQTDHGSHVAGIAAANRYVTVDGERQDALAAVKVAGNAPDAQLLVMKVFGKNGGASDSDYMAAIEDAIVLGADTVNLSLGSSNPGFTNAGAYEGVMESLELSGIVACVSAGNSSYWAKSSNTASHLGSGLLYAEDVNYDTMGSPASYPNTMTVASVENDGGIYDTSITAVGAGGERYATGYNETIYNNMKAFSTLDTSADGSGTEYDFVFTDGLATRGDFDFIDVEGKIIIASRGETAFYEKATYIEELGAVGAVIYNNVDGTVGMDMSSYQGEMPAVSITKAAGAAIRAMGEEKADADGNAYRTGKLVVNSSTVVMPGMLDHAEMSDFSSWGTTGDLALKPEITAPGGNIRSVRGDTADIDLYRVYSGTSMASPQVAGIAALVSQYVGASGLADRTGLSKRQLEQSLLMSTAQPLKDGNGNYYPVIQQGAGMVDASAAVGADSVIVMDSGSTPSAADGKVKAELGDDPERKGVYELGFRIYNASAEEKTFDLSADAFTQDVTEAESKKGSGYTSLYQKTSTRALDATSTFSGAASGASVKVPAGGSADVRAKIQLTASAKQWMEESFANGAYVQAYVSAVPRASGDGGISSAHSIPVLAFYGSWTDPYMFDGGSYKEGKLVSNYATAKTTDESRKPYSPLEYGGNHLRLELEKQHKQLSSTKSGYGGNPVVADSVYKPERNAFSADTKMIWWRFAPMRDYVKIHRTVVNKTTGEEYFDRTNEGTWNGSYYVKNSDYWNSGTPVIGLDRPLMTFSDTPTLKEGDVLEVTLTITPEYYSEGKMGENKEPGPGATLRISGICDYTPPEIEDIVYDAEEGVLKVTAADENYVAAVALYTLEGKVADYQGSRDEIERGAEAEYSLKAESGGYLVQAFDYAGNVSTYRISVGDSSLTYHGTMLAYDVAGRKWVRTGIESPALYDATEQTRFYNAATAVGDSVYGVAYDSELYRVPIYDLATTDPEYVGTMGANTLDLAYNPADGMLYGIADTGRIVRFNLETGRPATVGAAPIRTNTLACGADGTFYSARYGTGEVYSYTLASLGTTDLRYDFDGNGAVDEDDCRALLAYATGERSSLSSMDAADIDGDGKVGTHDALLLLDLLPGRANLVTNTGISSRYLQAMEMDLDSGLLYWTAYYAYQADAGEFAVAALFEMDPATGEHTRIYLTGRQLCSLIVLEKGRGGSFDSVQDMDQVIPEPKEEDPWWILGNGDGYGAEADWVEGEDLGDSDPEMALTPEDAGMQVATDDVAADALASFKAAAAAAATDGSATDDAAVSLEDAAVTVGSDFDFAGNADADGSILPSASTAADGSSELALTSKSRISNALYEIAYDPSKATLASWNSDLPLASFHADEKAGRVVFGFASNPSIAPGERLATLYFSSGACGAEATVRTVEQGAERPGTKAAFQIAVHSWGEWQTTRPATCTTDGERVRTCSLCNEVETEAIPAGDELHEWGDWKVATTPTNEEPGVQARTCSVCGETERKWFVSEDAELLDVKHHSTRLYANEDYVHWIDITGAEVESVSRISTESRSISYLVDVAAESIENGSFDLNVRQTPIVGAGYGVAIKREIVGSVGWDLNESDYTASVENGVAVVRFYSYYGQTDYTTVTLYINAVETGHGVAGSAEMVDGSFVRRFIVHHAPVISLQADYRKVDFANREFREYNVFIRVDDSVPDDAELQIEPVFDRYEYWRDPTYAVIYGRDDYDENGTEAANISMSSLSVKMQNGTALARFVSWDPESHLYTVHLRNRDVPEPQLIGNGEGSAFVQAGDTYELDLSTVFEGNAGYEMSYSVAADGGEPEAVGQTFSFTPDEAGQRVFKFTASNGFRASETYTLTLTAREVGLLPGDVNGDGGVDVRDSVMLNRYLAGWSGVEVDAKASDVNGDGVIDVRDLVRLRRYLAGWYDSL